MTTIKQRFRKTKSSIKINTALFVVLLIAALVGGFLLSDSEITKLKVFEKEEPQISLDNQNCSELLNLTQEFIDESNYWRNEDIRCEKELWTCQIQIHQLQASLK
ncbi:hypothetical protein ACFLZ7_04395 [Nanoarchaeota archaeon]